MKNLIPMLILSLGLLTSCGSTSSESRDTKLPQDSSTISNLGQDSDGKLPPDFSADDEERTIYSCTNNATLVEQTIVLGSGDITGSKTLQTFSHSEDCKQALLELTPDELDSTL